ncbi:hypothetical protein VMCG_06934 [Cytospora schulzeri]|uniref:Uncharacterized protein n=1 Tax=Cytospora schulzeri TaxID=448051 RepID=A0A423W277_9PEZI|nr:hypothetical protein VMCG_06934 [Valsa malicola]
MAVLKSLLASAIACIAIINSVAGVSTVMPSHSLSVTVTVTAELFTTTLTTTLTFTNGGGVQLPSTYIPGYPIPGDVNGAVKGNVLVMKTVTVPATDSTSTFSSAIAATEEAHAGIQDMTLSLSASTSSKTFALSTTIFPDPGIFGHPPPVETASTKYTAMTTPDFPIVPSIMPDGTRPGQHAVDADTTTLAASTTVTIPDIISVTSADGLLYSTGLPMPLTHKTLSSSYTSSTGKTSQKAFPTIFTCTTDACADQLSLPPVDLPFHPQHSRDLTSTPLWMTSSRLPWHAHNTTTISNGTTTNPTDGNIDVIASSQIGAPFSTLTPSLFTPEIESPTQPTGTPTLPLGVWPIHILGGISASSHSIFTAQMTTLETSIRSTKT